MMMFSVDVVNIKVVDNFLVFVLQKFHNFRPTGLGAIDFTNTLSGFVCVMDSVTLICLFD